MKIISWNVNGIRAVNRKGVLQELVENQKPDIICLQEIKCSDDICIKELEAKYNDVYPYIYFNTSKTKKGYSGTAILSVEKPISVVYDLVEHDNDEGRVLTAVFKDFILVTVYTPNSGAELRRLSYRVSEWDVAFKRYINGLANKFSKTPLIVCGDLNVAHKEIDVYNPKRAKGAGFMPEERRNFDDMITDINLADSFREFHPTVEKYSYWSALGRSRIRNSGWRIDYFLINKWFLNKLSNADILTDVMGSDHAPILIQW